MGGEFQFCFSDDVKTWMTIFSLNCTMESVTIVPLQIVNGLTVTASTCRFMRGRQSESVGEETVPESAS